MRAQDRQEEEAQTPEWMTWEGFWEVMFEPRLKWLVPYSYLRPKHSKIRELNAKMIHQPKNNRDFKAPKWAVETRIYEFWSGARFWIFMSSNQGKAETRQRGFRPKYPELLVSTGGHVAGRNWWLGTQAAARLSGEFFRAVMQCSQDSGLLTSWGPFLNEDGRNHSLRFRTPMKRT